MFERYDEAARRALFFARHEASRLGTRQIELEHLLLGLVRQPAAPVGRVLDRAAVSADDVARAVEALVPHATPFATSVEIPFSAPCKAAMRAAEEEADLVGANGITCGHLLAGLLRQHESVAATTLRGLGISLSSARHAVGPAASPFGPDSGFEVGISGERLSVGSLVPWVALEGAAQAVRAGNHVWVAGTAGHDADGRIVGPNDAYLQARQALLNLGERLASVDASLRHVVRTRLFVVNLARDRQRVARAHGEAFATHAPAATIVEVRALSDPQALVEIEADAFVA